MTRTRKNAIKISTPSYNIQSVFRILNVQEGKIYIIYWRADLNVFVERMLSMLITHRKEQRNSDRKKKKF